MGAWRSFLGTTQAYGERRNACNHAWSIALARASPGYPSTHAADFAFVFPGQGSQSVGMGRDLADVLARRRGRLRRRRRRPRRADQHARLGWPSRAARPDRERPAGHSWPTSIAILEALRERWAAEGLAGPDAGVRRRPLDGPVLGARRGRRAVARGRRPPRPRARPADAGIRPGSRRRDGRAHRARRRKTPRAGRRGRRAWHVRRRQPQRPGPGRRVRRARRDRGRRRARPVARRQAGDRPARVSVAAHSPLMAEAADGMREALAGDRRSTIRRRTLLANADGRPITTRRRRAGRARRAPDRRASTGSARSSG